MQPSSATRSARSAYFHSYHARNPLEFTVHRFIRNSEQIFRNFVSPQSPAFDYGKRIYFFLKKMT
jgi:hypothetical protein